MKRTLGDAPMRPWFVWYLTEQPAATSHFSWRPLTYCSRSNLVKPHLADLRIFWRPGNLNLARRSATITASAFASLARTLRSAWPMETRAARSMGLPYEWRMPDESRSAPAQESILFWRITWNGCARVRMWYASLPQFLIRYLLHATRAASSAFDEICSFSSDTRCATNGNWSTDAFLFPQSKMRIFGSGTPRQYRDLMYGLFFWNREQRAGRRPMV